MVFFEAYYGWILLVITIVLILSYKKLTKNADAITSRYEAQKKINVNPNDSVSYTRQALENAGFRNIGFNKEDNRFYAETKFSMSSFLEYIEVSLEHNDSSTNLTFKSICALPVQIFAWGKNKRNYKRFARELEQLIDK